ncbi:MAG: hypothetical protein HY060_07790 [Proteobacteria bacterium]|nr:hypothetical protein [Pseudomonadota bacterium]
MTATATVSDIRDRSGRFKPGCSGNPAGKPPGAQNWSTRLKGVIDPDDFAAVARKTVEKAKEGSGVDARFLISHLDPRPKVAPIELPTGGTLIERCEILWNAMATGEITPDQAVMAGRLLNLERQAAATPRRAAAPAVDLAALRAEIEATVRAEVTAELRTELTAAIRAEVVAELRAEIVAELARIHPPGLPPEAAAREGGLPTTSPAPAQTLNNPCISSPKPAPTPRTPSAPPGRPATWRNAATVDRMLQNAGAPAPETLSPEFALNLQGRAAPRGRTGLSRVA